MCFEKKDEPEFEKPNDPNPSMPMPSPVRQGIKNVFGDVDVGRTGGGDGDPYMEKRPGAVDPYEDRIRQDATNPYQNFMNNYRDSTGQKLNRFVGDGGIKNLSPVMALFDAFRGGKDGSTNMTDATDRLTGQIFRYAAANPDSVTSAYDGLGLNIDTGTGTLNVKPSGFTTYSGTQNPDYDGPFADLVNPPPDDGGDDAQAASQPFDPCPEGFKYNAETQQCEPVADDAADDAEDKPKFTRNPTPISEAFPDLTRYGREGGEYQFFASMPGVPDPNLAEGGAPRGPQGEVKGPGGPKDDLVGPFMLSSKEYVLPYEMVLDEGNGNYNQGIKSLEQQRMAALKKYKARAASA